MKENFVELLEVSIKKNWTLNALSDFQKKPITFGDVAAKIAWFHDLFRKNHLQPGDKIALLGKNSTNWAVTCLATMSYGAVVVPILPDFKTDDIHHIVNHSDSKLFFCSEIIYEKLDESNMPALDSIFSLENFELLFTRKKTLKQYLHLQKNKGKKLDVSAETFSLPKIPNEKLAEISYTSGTTGFSKGVMLPHNSLAANLVNAQNNMPLKTGDSILNFLPLAHSYGCTVGFLYPFSVGCHVIFLDKTPSPKIIIKALQEVRPQLILTVPLIIEKIYTKQIKPKLNSQPLKTLSKLPIISKMVKKSIKNRLVELFGGNFHEIVLGGAAFNKETEKFLHEIKFPFTVGYGMTECGPWVSFSPNHKIHRLQGVGKFVDTLEVKIDSEDPHNKPGEILVRGENVMQGYYKNEAATKAAIDKEGWLHTGDMGILDEDGFIYIKGRCKNMILGPSGQNIYPEEIESRLNNMPLVQESLIIEHKNKLTALVYPDIETVDSRKISDEKLKIIMENNRKKLNEQLPAYSHINNLEIYPEEFEKTPTKKIKRFLYTIASKE